MIDIDTMIAAARNRLYKMIDLRCAIAHAKERRSTIARRYGQIYRNGRMPK